MPSSSVTRPAFTMTNFTLIFGGALIVNVVATTMSSEWFNKRKGGASQALVSAEEVDAKKRWHALLKKYLPVYLLATLSDWLQGPYVRQIANGSWASSR